MQNSNNKYKTGKIRSDNRAKIIAIAEMEFAEFGYKGASIMNIAKRANMPRANVHYYFKSKLQLYKKVLMDILQLWNQAFNQITPEDDPAEAIGAYIKAKVMYSKTNPLASKIFANEIIHGAPRISEYLNNDFRDWLKSKSAVIEHWIKQEKMDPIDPLFLIMLIWSATQHYADFSTQVSAVMDKPQLTDQDFDNVSDNLIHIILKGCGIKPPSSINP